MRARSGLIALFGLICFAPATAEALCEAPGDPDCVVFQESFRGTIDFFATGAAFTVNNDGDDRPDQALDEASVTVPSAKIPPRAELVRAFVYFGGSLYEDQDDVEVPDTNVEIQFPGAADFVTVEGDEVYTSGGIPGFPEVSLYSVRADITDAMTTAGGPLTGTYRVRGFEADIFDGPNEHTAANASFSIVLIFKEPRLPPRAIALFDGMQEVLGSTVTLELANFIVSEQPSGSLTLYALEGDCNPGPDACDRGNNLAGREQALVIGADPARTLVLEDALNPPNDLFNRTINTVDPPGRNVTGTDIDTFDISPVLRPGDESARVQVTTPLPANGQAGELVGLAYVVVGIDVFAPEFRTDSRIEIATERGSVLPKYFPGDPLRVTYALSNTGNLPGTEVSLIAEMPETVADFVVLSPPEGAEINVDREGGAAGKGRIEVTGLGVRHGEVDDLVLLVETVCPLPEGGALELSADVSEAKEGSAAFTMTSSVPLVGREICGPRYLLYGGGGCRGASPDNNASGPAGWMLLLGFVLLGVRTRGKRRGKGWLGLAVVLSSTQGACSSDVEMTLGPDRPAPAALGFACPDHMGMVVIPSIRGEPPFCIDQYEASLDVGELGNPNQPEGGDGSTTVVAQSMRFVRPASRVTWHQAAAACRNAGKRLCSAREWRVACRGDTELTYPYGDTYEGDTCNGFAATRGGVVETGAMIESVIGASGALEAHGCVSTHGAYDLSGNVWEWNADVFLSGARRGLAGGSFRSNPTGLRCVTQDSHADPVEENETYGFRCCVDFSR